MHYSKNLSSAYLTNSTDFSRYGSPAYFRISLVTVGFRNWALLLTAAIGGFLGFGGWYLEGMGGLVLGEFSFLSADG